MKVTDATQCFLRICWEIFINGLRANTDNISYLLLDTGATQQKVATFHGMDGDDTGVAMLHH